VEGALFIYILTTINFNDMEWISVKDRLPELDTNVLIYWKLSKDKKEGGYWDMIEIALLDSITKRKESISTEWRDSDYNTKNPTHWMPLPEPPTN
jgi:Protein of unknown function (DUF551)